MKLKCIPEFAAQARGGAETRRERAGDGQTATMHPSQGVASPQLPQSVIKSETDERH